jgi:uncharacterized protein (DUF1800 family)
MRPAGGSADDEDMPVTAADAAHLLRRSGFGFTKAQLTELTELPDRTAAVDRVLDLSRAPTAALPVPPFVLFQDMTAPWVAMVHWWIDRMRTTPVPIVEKLTLFWHGHFACGLGKVPVASMLATQNQLFRANALGNYHALAQGVAIDPAMLSYLDNWLNRSGASQENFARELMELFTLGQGHYTQADVVAMAKAWSGHSVDDKAQLPYLFRATWHDNAKKQLFAVPARNWNGPEALTEIIKGSKRVPAARFITAKLFSYLAYPVKPDDAVVAPLADVLLVSGWSIHALVRAIFRSDAFWSDSARHALVRSPIEWMVATLQATGLSAGQTNPQWWMGNAGQCLFNPPGVEGWGQNEYWLSTSASWARSGFAAHVRWQARNAGVLASTVTSQPADAVQQAFDRFGIVDPAPTTRAALEAYVTKAHHEGAGWTVQPNLILLTALSPDFQVA